MPRPSSKQNDTPDAVTPETPVVPDSANSNMPPTPIPDKDPALETVLTADPQKPIAPPKKAEAGKPCPDCKKGVVTVYGKCIACFDKLPKVEKRKLYLLAKVSGVNAHEYPPEHMKTWKTELQLIAAGLWKGPLKVKAIKKSLGDLAT